MDFFDSPRKLTKSDLIDMLLPREFYRTELADIRAESLRQAVSNYIDNMRSAFDQSVGLLLWGPPASGKGAAAAVIAKAARSRYKPAMFISIGELRETLVTRILYKDNKTPMERAKEVDFLVLDGLDEEDETEKLLSLVDLERLIVNRARQRKLTIVTTRMTPRELAQGKGKFKKFYEAVSMYLQPVECPAPEDAVRARRDQMLKLLIGEDD